MPQTPPTLVIVTLYFALPYPRFRRDVSSRLGGNACGTYVEVCCEVDCHCGLYPPFRRKYREGGRRIFRSMAKS